ncbi:MAG: energy transducer TonB [Proteobacteria bacterium]|nr:energy transducer TonB [Pseudomonadota bacterium]
MHISGIYRSNALSYIELTMQEVSKPFTRSIPRPRPRPKATDLPKDIQQLKITSRPIPRLKPVNFDPVEKTLPDSLVEGLSMPDVSATTGLDIAEWNPGAYSGAYGDFDSRRSYLEMVRLNIERHKEYPDMARLNHIEGRVTIRFVITPEGGVREVEVAKRSGTKALDQAALKAVQDAAPFPKPPGHLFAGEIPLELTIVFELT